MYNKCEDGAWGTSDYLDTKEKAIKLGVDYYEGESFWVGQIEPNNCGVGVNVDNILEDIHENVSSEIGSEIAEDYLCDVKSEHSEILEERLNEVLVKWMEEFSYTPSFFKMTNVEKIETIDL
ncbi:hypothetical protein B9T62_18315 [Paenibacillus donghaensis]|uniref:Uncharacterized protein n=2 Tax=Paenibacillus donghaensis TaxID=414771 RepID=A0A2Z2KT94_9BACL|nr:hypothetical protein B9T62_18315 [Paenibacillus donghaensis]